MLCPKCNIEARISNKAYVMKNGKLFIRYEYSCRNKNCARYEKPIGEEDEEIKNVIFEEPTAEEPPKEVEESAEESTNNTDEEASE